MWKGRIIWKNIPLSFEITKCFFQIITQILPNFDPLLLPSSGQLWTFYWITTCSSVDFLHTYPIPPSSCPRSYWRTAPVSKVFQFHFILMILQDWNFRVFPFQVFFFLERRKISISRSTVDCLKCSICGLKSWAKHTSGLATKS